MASYKDEAHIKFNPYVQELPVEDMAKVGMAKQGQYNEGVQKIQQNIDNIAGMDVYRDVDKRYLQSRLNKLGNELRFVAAGDFSNFQLVNSVNGMSNQIANDDYVRNAQASTAHIRKEQTQMELDEKAGKLTPDNAYKFNKQLAQYANSKDLSESFSAPYIPNFDVFKFAKETFDAVKPDGLSFDQVYELGADGKPAHDRQGNLIYSKTMTRMESEGISTDKVKATLGQIFADPRVGQQLQISGEYNYRGLDAPALGEKVWNQKQEIMGAYDDKLLELSLEKTMGKDVQAQIDSIEENRKRTSESYDQYIEMASTNPDAVRGNLYKDDINTRYTTMFGYQKTKTQILDNPGWSNTFKLQQEANEQSRFAQRLSFDIKKEKNDNYWKQKNYDQKDREIAINAKEKAKKAADEDGKINDTTQEDAQPSTIDKGKIQAVNYENAANEYSTASNELIWQTVLGKIPSNVAKLKTLQDKGATRQQAIDIMFTNTARQQNISVDEFKAHWSSKAITAYNNLSPVAKANNHTMSVAVDNYNSSKKVFDSESIVENKIRKNTENTLGIIKRNVDATPINNQKLVLGNGKVVTITKEDMYDIAIIEKSGDDPQLRSAARQAEQRLKKRGKAEIANLPDISAGGYVDASIGFGGNSLASIMNEYGKISKHFNNDLLEKSQKIKNDIIDRDYTVLPNRKMSIMGGTKAENDAIFNYVKTWAGNYGTGNLGNLSPDFKKFVSSLGKDLNESTLEAKVIIDDDNTRRVEIVSYVDGKRAGGMTISNSEAASIGIDVEKMYENREVRALKAKINANFGSTSSGDAQDTKTYIQGDAYLNKKDFKLMTNSPYDVMGNVTYENDLYVGHIFVSNGRDKNVIELEGSTDLNATLEGMKLIDPTTAQQILIQK